MPNVKDRPDQNIDTDFDAWEKELNPNSDQEYSQQGIQDAENHAKNPASHQETPGNINAEPDQSLQDQDQDQNQDQGKSDDKSHQSHGKQAKKARDEWKKSKNAKGNLGQGAKVGSRGVGLGAAEGGGAAAGGSAAAEGAAGFFSSPPGWFTIAVIIILIIIIIIIVLILTIIAAKAAEDEAAGEEQSLTITKEGPTTAKNGETLNYIIRVTDLRPAKEIAIIDHLPADVQYVSSTWKAKYDAGAKTVSWLASENFTVASGSALPANFTISLTVKALKDKVTLVNWAEANSEYIVASGSGESSGAVGGYIPPSTDNCNGKYKLNNSIKKNFGDPDCSFSKDKLKQLLEQLDSKNANTWFAKIIPCESTYNPNAFNPNTPDPQGAWGLIQMGSSKPPGQPPSSPGRNGKYDRGDTVWSIQISNALNYAKAKKISNNLGAYWECAR